MRIPVSSFANAIMASPRLLLINNRVFAHAAGMAFSNREIARSPDANAKALAAYAHAVESTVHYMPVPVMSAILYVACRKRHAWKNGGDDICSNANQYNA